MIPLTDSVQFRFTATDQLLPTHVECAIDDFRVLRLNCSYDETFRRGDANLNSSIQLDDVVFLLETIFEGSQVLYCPDAGDANDDGAVDLTDAITVLSYIFAGEPLPLPSVCGVDPTPDSLSCIQPDGCR